MKSSKPILLVEDDEVDAMTVRRALDDLKVKNRLEMTEHGEEALAYLRDPDEERPCVILLDLRMPRMNGIEFLEIIKSDRTLKRIPVVVMTTSREEQDIVKTFDLGVAGYIVKPVDYNRFVETMRTIDLYWTLSELPPEG